MLQMSMSVLIPLIMIVGVSIGVVVVFLLHSIIAPKKISALAALVKQNKYQAAVRVAKKLLLSDSRNAAAHYLLALAYLGDQKSELALMELKTVNQIGQFDEHCPEIPFRKKIAELFIKFNQPEEALKEYLLLIKREPGVAEYHSAIGGLFEVRNRNDRAVQYYRKAIELEPRDAAARYRLGLIMYRLKNPVEARAEFETALRLDPENHAAHFYLGRLFKENREYQAALGAFEKAQKDPELKMKALVERGACLMSMNNYERAIGDLERAVKLSPDDSAPESLYARYFLSLCHEKNRDIEQAIEQWENIYARKPTFKDVADKLIHYQEFRQDDRIKDFLTAGQEAFLEMCKQATMSLGLVIQDTSPIQDGCQIVAVESQSKWRNARRIPKLIRFLRVAEMVDESTVRSMHEEMRRQNILRGILVTSSTFSRLAIAFAESRPVELYNKDRLQKLLHGSEKALTKA